MIPLMKIHSPPNIGNTLQKVFDSGFITEGEYSDRFEKQFGEYIENINTCLVNSCTSALSLAAHMCNIKHGDEVITTAMTCMATNEPFFNMGAKLVFADIEKDTGNICVKDIERKITKKTKAIVMVHWAGQPCKIDEINAIAKKHGIKTVEDAAHALRSTYKGKRVGSHSDYVCFSFQAVKHLSTGDGGAIACKTEEDATRIRKLRWFGLDRNFKSPPGQPPASRWEQDITESGYKFHMNNINASIGIEQMKYVDGLIDSHIENGKYYDKNIKNDKIHTLFKSRDVESSYWIYTILTDDRENLKKHLEKNNIACDVAHVRNDQYTCFSQFKTDNPGLDHFDKSQLNIPVGWWLSKSDREHIVNTINNFV
jgi:dTDP-4-amino-4,6-dideoxygalactose transaminase